MQKIAEIFSETQLKTLQQDIPTPLYFRLYSLLKNAILDGTIENGGQMPTEQQLAENFSVSRITAKRAIEMLQEIESMARHTDVVVLECKKQMPPGAVREALDLEDKEKALHVVRVRSRDGQPFGYYSSWTNGLTKAVSKRDFQKSPRLAIFRKQGLKITHVTQTISAVAASQELAQHLETAPGAPLISLIRHSFETRNGQEHLADYLQVFYHPERFQYRMDLQMDDR